MIRRSVSTHCMLIGLPLSLAMSSPYAQTQEEVIDEIRVTGSLITRASVFEGRAPIQSIDAQAIEASGATQPVDILKSITANSGSVLANEQSELQGTSQFSLRALGLSSSLTLINGRRAGIAPIGDASGSTFFDINTLPLSMIDRIEVLRDGASATYGSEAIAGVANIITRKGFEGFELSGSYRDASHQSYDVSFAMGVGGERGHMNLYGSHFVSDENFRTDLGFIRDRIYDPEGNGNLLAGSLTSAIGGPGSVRRAVVEADGTATGFPGALFSPDADCEAAGGVLGGPLCRSDFADSRTVIAAEERWQLFAEGDYHISERLTAFVEGSVSQNIVTDRVGAQTYNNSNVEGIGGSLVPGNHPFNFWTDPDDNGRLVYIDPTEWDSDIHQAVDLAYLGRPLFGVEANNRDNAQDIEREFSNLRFVIGLEFEFSDSWSGIASLTRANSKITTTTGQMTLASVWHSQLIDGSWNPFGTAFVNPDLVTPKTVEGDGLNPLRVGAKAANSPDDRQRWDLTDVQTGKTQVTVLDMVTTGEFFQLGSTVIPVALGAQYRTLKFEQRSPPIFGSGQGLIAANFEFPVESSQDVWAVFAETIVPIGDSAEVQFALRHEDYDSAGSTTDPKISAHILATDSFSLRGSWGTSFQAPTLIQVAGNTTTGAISDPFNAEGICTVVDGNIVPTGINSTVVTRVAGGSLGPQKADNYNFGVMFSPTYAFRMSLDYWKFKMKGVIAQDQSFQAILDDDCLSDGLPTDPRVFRSPGGQVSRVEAEFVNVGRLNTDGFDLHAVYDFETNFGSFEVSALATLITSFDVDAAGDGFVDQLGSRNARNGFGANPELRYNLGVLWSSGNHTGNVSMRYIDSYKNDQTSIDSPPKISSWTTFDISYAYTITDLLGSDTEAHISIGLNNLFDKDPPGLPTNQSGAQRFNQRPGFDGTVHDIRGRQAYLRLRVSL